VTTETELLAEIYRAPDDDAPRAVYADWLLERGRVHGELIALQLLPGDGLTAAQLDRMIELLHRHERDFLGELAPYVMRPHFARGFLDRCRVLRAKAIDPTPPPDPAWATVIEIEDDVPATDACPMPALRSAVGLSARTLARIAALAAPPPHLHTLGYRQPAPGLARADDDRAAAAFATLAPRLPALRRLELHAVGWIAATIGPADVRVPWRAAPLDELDVTGHLDRLVAWFDAIEHSTLRRFVIQDGIGAHGWIVQLARDDTGAWSELRITNRSTSNALADALERFARLVDRIPALAVFEMDAFGLRAVGERLTRALDRHAGLDVRTIRGL